MTFWTLLPILNLRYEDLLIDPVETLMKIVDFIGYEGIDTNSIEQVVKKVSPKYEIIHCKEKLLPIYLNRFSDKKMWKFCQVLEAHINDDHKKLHPHELGLAMDQIPPEIRDDPRYQDCVGHAPS